MLDGGSKMKPKSKMIHEVKLRSPQVQPTKLVADKSKRASSLFIDRQDMADSDNQTGF